MKPIVDMKNFEQDHAISGTRIELICSQDSYDHDSFSLLLQETDDFIEMLIHKFFIEYQIQHLEKTDVKQDILLKLHQKLKKGKYKVISGHSIQAWIFRLIQNHFIDISRSTSYKQYKKLNLHQHEYILESVSPFALEADHAILHQELLEHILNSIQQLDEQKQYAIQEHIFQNRAFSKIAEELELNQNTVQGWYFRWKEKLRYQLHGQAYAA